MVTNYFLISDSLPRLLNEVQCLSLNLYESTLHLTALNKRWLTKSRNSSSILFHGGPGECWTGSPGSSMKSKVKGGVVKGPGAWGSTWRNDQCWRRSHCQPPTSCCRGCSPRKLMKERRTDNSCCFDMSFHLVTGRTLTTREKKLLPRERAGASESVIRARHCWHWVEIKVLANKGSWTESSEPRTLSADQTTVQNPRQERWGEPAKPLSPPCRTGRSKRRDTICSLSQKREFQFLMVSNANIFKSITLITND